MTPATAQVPVRFPQTGGMMRTLEASLVSLPLLLAAASPSMGGDWLDDGGFETGSVQNYFPTSFGVWGGDEADIVAQNGDIVPLAGGQMLQFIYSGTFDPGPQVGCDLFQLVDIESLRELIDTGEALASCRGSFNRVSGDEETDTLFRLSIRAYVGDPADFLSIFDQYIASSRESVYSDADPASWESLDVFMVIPAETSFLAVVLEAREDVFNDLDAPEFDGHFADEISLHIDGPVPLIHSTWGTVKAEYR